MPVRDVDVTTHAAIRQYEREPSSVNALSLVLRLLVGRVTALNLIAFAILLSCVWCASGLIAIDAATLWPTFLTPMLTHEQFAVPVTASTMAVLFAAAPTAHLTGKFTIHQYKLWNPLKGGTSFVAAQTAGWSLYGAGFMLVCFDLVNKLAKSRSSTDAYLPCFTCTPGFLIGVALLALVGNACLLGSLYLYDASEHGARESRTRQTLVRCAATCLLAVVALSALLARHPMIKPYLVEAPAEFSTDGIDLPFCEPPYEYSTTISQPASMIAHLPFVPLLLLIIARPPLHAAATRLLIMQSALQLWTALAGHALGNPRAVRTQEVSIVLVGLAFHAFVQSIAAAPRPNAPPAGVLGGRLGEPCNEVLATCVGVCLWYLAFGLASAIVVGFVVIAAIVVHANIFGRLSPVAVTTLAVATPLMFCMLGVEVAFCATLLRVSRAPWHVPFDVVFWQGYWSIIDVIALAKPGSVWLVSGDTEETATTPSPTTRRMTRAAKAA